VKSKCVIHTSILLHLFKLFTTELHVIAVGSYTARDKHHNVPRVLFVEPEDVMGLSQRAICGFIKAAGIP
jgi:hypothetical protein